MHSNKISTLSLPAAVCIGLTCSGGGVTLKNKDLCLNVSLIVPLISAGSTTVCKLIEFKLIWYRKVISQTITSDWVTPTLIHLNTYIHTLSRESPDCCHHIKLEIDAIGLLAKPDMLSFAESTTALTSFFCFLLFFPSCHSVLKKFLLKVILVINSLLNPVNITDISMRKSAALWKIWLTFKSCEIFGQQDSSSRYVLLIRITQYAGAWKFYLNL